MSTIRVRVEGGRLIGEAPPGIPEGTVLELCLADEPEDMTSDELVALNASIEKGWIEMEAGLGRPAGEVIAELRTLMHDPRR